MIPSFFSAAPLLLSFFGHVAAQSSHPVLPTVDLGYTFHQALSVNETGRYYNFSNIRFAAAPTGNNRFRAPTLPTGTNRTVTNGGVDNVVCPQATPTWEANADVQLTLLFEALASRNTTLFEEVLDGVIVNATSTSALISSGGNNGTSQASPGVTEDCLFLDLILPFSAWETRNDTQAKAAPVIIWLYGSGYVAGDKRNTGNPLATGGFTGGLVTRSTHSANGSEIEPSIIVSPNYRLGLFGWLAGSTVSSDGTPNAGLFDQRLAMEWVQKYVHLFGGDPARVTVIGESAGAGSIEHHLTAYGGANGSLPFQRAIPQSPTFYPVPADDSEPENITQAVLKLTNTTTLAQLRALPSSLLQKTNELVVAQSSYGFFSFGPVVDGSYVPDLPGRLFLEGRYHKNIQLMLGHNQNEAFIFTSPFIQNTTAAFDALVAQQFPEANASTQNYIEQNLYPPSFSASTGYVTEFGRQAELYTDSQFVCNNLFMAQAVPKASYWYDFNVVPGIHGQDLASTWAQYPPADSATVNATVAAALQEFILTFAATGIPAAGSVDVQFPTYRSDRRVLELSDQAIAPTQDTTSEYRCGRWQAAPYAE